MSGPKSGPYEEVELDERQSRDPHAVFLSKFRKAALAEVDNAKFSRFHVKVCIVAGIGYAPSLEPF